ncbi:endonuclease/exonuclease/phosphatase family protein [Sphingobium sp. LB126]|uniref:endonuclease/exonuclease/phosphatase family protein n=1 Tax=Sphingobium sp. LB126 TaxID=1983755 RepID=UPI000C202033|nr:endonuclease/exonuclease/phosphatase family protein [Sphingobium sp. LB126]
MNRFWKIGIIVSVLALLGARHPHPLDVLPAPSATPRFDGTLSVLTYNVKGLPWPVALGRGSALEQIASRLRALRSSGRAPQVVVLQEAFTDEARSIGVEAGYRYVVSGPEADDAGSTSMTHEDRAYASGARWFKGETAGKYVGSGLQILSDYPIRAVSRIAFPSFACAGFDCLANKGALLARLDIPGAATPIDVLTTHLNSRRASRVGDFRTIYAYRRQVGVLSEFIRDNHDLRLPLIAAGDFNVGSAAPRREFLLADVRTKWVQNEPVRDALGQFQRQGGILSSDAADTFRRARDWQFYSDGKAGRLVLTGIDVPFGHDRPGGMLSDHVGYVARYRLEAPNAAAGDVEQATKPVRWKT